MLCCAVLRCAALWMCARESSFITPALYASAAPLLSDALNRSLPFILFVPAFWILS